MAAERKVQTEAAQSGYAEDAEDECDDKNAHDYEQEYQALQPAVPYFFLMHT